jgi:hypothetical protein
MTTRLRWRPQDAAVLAQGAATLIYAASDTFADVDLWWHLRLGDDIWTRGGLPWRDIYSYLSKDGPYTNHEWLAELTMSRAFAWGGDAGLVVLKLLLTFGIAALLVRHLLSSGATLLAAVLVAVTSILLFLPGFGTVRPQQFSYLLFTVTLLLLSATTERPRLAWWLPVVVAVWVNLHGAVLTGLAIIAAWWMTERCVALFTGSPARLGILPVVASFVALAVNPWGFAILEFLRGAVSSRPELTEWNPIEFAGLEGALYGTALLFAVLGCSGRWRPRWPAMVVVACTAVAPLLARRHLPFFVLATAVLAGPAMVRHVRHLVAARWPSAMSREEGPPWHWPIVAALFAEASFLMVLSVPRIRCITVEAEHYPIAAVTTLKAAGATGRMATFFDWGGFVLDALGPRLLVSMDPRRETVYGGDAYGVNEQFTLGLGDWDSLLIREPRPDLALVSKAFPTFNLMRSHPGWSLVIEDQAGGLFVRDASPVAATVKRAAPAVFPPEAHCFSAARRWLGGAAERPRAILGAAWPHP